MLGLVCSLSFPEKDSNLKSPIPSSFDLWILSPDLVSGLIFLAVSKDYEEYEVRGYSNKLFKDLFMAVSSPIPYVPHQQAIVWQSNHIGLYKDRGFGLRV